MCVCTLFPCLRGESWKYSTGPKNGLYAFGDNSAESEPIWMKSEPNVGSWPWQISGAICAVATV